MTKHFKPICIIQTNEVSKMMHMDVYLTGNGPIPAEMFAVLCQKITIKEGEYTMRSDEVNP